MMLSHTTIVFMRYAMLALESRNSNDPRTIDDLFYYMCDEAEDIMFSMSLMLLVELLKKILNDNPVVSKKGVQILCTTKKNWRGIFYAKKKCCYVTFFMPNLWKSFHLFSYVNPGSNTSNILCRPGEWQ